MIITAGDKDISNSPTTKTTNTSGETFVEDSKKDTDEELEDFLRLDTKSPEQMTKYLKNSEF